MRLAFPGERGQVEIIEDGIKRRNHEDDHECRADQSEGDRFNIIGLTAGDILSFDVFEHQNGNIFLEVDINGETTRLAKITDFVASDLTVEMLADQTEAYLF